MKNTEIILRTYDCTGCGCCVEACRRGILSLTDNGRCRFVQVADAARCTGCRSCERSCRSKAISIRKINPNPEIFQKNNDMKTNKKKLLLKEVGAHIAGGLILLATLPFLIMWLWNALIPDIFAVSPIGFWQAAGLYLLARLLTCPLHARFDVDRDERRRHRKHRDSHHHLHEQMHGMSHEERREFIRRRMHALCDEQTAENPADDAPKE